MTTKSKTIAVECNDEPQKIYVLVRRKHKLTELYPQRAILEESRKNSSLIQANDWIDHDYYERVVAESDEKNRRLQAKYGPKPPRLSTSDTVSKPMTKIIAIKPFEEY